MATLFLHIGHGKTGTSWIQACLRLNRDSMAQQGIIYASGEDRFIDQPNRITSGNASNLFKSKEDFESQLSQNQIKTGEALLFSSEHIFVYFIRSNAIDYFEEIAEKYGFDNIKVLLFIRNPITLAVSTWQQRIKRRGEYNVSLSNLHEHPDIGWDRVFSVEYLITCLEKCRNVSLSIRNYSNCSDRLIDEVADWLEVPVEIFSVQPVNRINRSLTWSEQSFQTSLNKIIGRSGRIFSDPLCEKLPDIIPEKILPPLEVQDAIWSSLSETIEQLNLQIPEKHRYQCDVRQPDPLPETLTFSKRQIEVVAESLGNEILNLRQQLEKANKTISNLKDEPAAPRNRLEYPIDNKSAYTRIKLIMKRITERFSTL
jgi:hypothetical protein